MDAPTAYQAAKLGMWLFLATEVLLFGGLFTGFAIYHYLYFEEFHHASKHLNRILGTVNTAVLLISSFFAAIAVDAAQAGNNKKVVRNLAITIICGFGFLIIKAIEYTSKADHGFFPGTAGHEFGAFNSPEFAHAFKMYFGLYYCMTGLHALHVVIGMGILAWVLWLGKKNRFSERYYTPVEVGA
ncbi:MAG: cytochrome C oxidase subunit III, partial [Proteobacteria bacterium]